MPLPEKVRKWKRFTLQANWDEDAKIVDGETEAKQSLCDLFFEQAAFIWVGFFFFKRAGGVWGRGSPPEGSLPVFSC